jgi:hypothetical protein
VAVRDQGGRRTYATVLEYPAGFQGFVKRLNVLLDRPQPV